MAQQFTLIWDNTAVLANTNATAQRVSYRRKITAGSWITTGFSVANDLAKSVTTVDGPAGLLDNNVYEHKVETICTLNGPTINDNGIREALGFACITPTITKNDVSASAVLDVTSTDLTKARFTLRKASDNTLISGPTVINRVANAISLPTVTGLVASTSYYFQIELYATVQAGEVISSQSGYLAALCGPYPFTTNASAGCNPVTGFTLAAIEV